MDSKIDRPRPQSWLMAHRGHATRFPENTLSALRASLELDVALIEFDIQLTADGVPVVLHDPTLLRTAGLDEAIHDVHSARLPELKAGYAQRFGARFRDEPLPSLADAVTLFQAFPGLTAVAEIKPESARRFGRQATVTAVMETLHPILAQTRVISFDAEVVALAREAGAVNVGWCLDAYDQAHHDEARDLAPQMLLANYQHLPPAEEPLWPGTWEWACWEVQDAGLALALRARGVDWVETMAVSELLSDPRLDAIPGGAG